MFCHCPTSTGGREQKWTCEKFCVFFLTKIWLWKSQAPKDRVKLQKTISKARIYKGYFMSMTPTVTGQLNLRLKQEPQMIAPDNRGHWDKQQKMTRYQIEHPKSPKCLLFYNSISPKLINVSALSFRDFPEIVVVFCNIMNIPLGIKLKTLMCLSGAGKPPS